MLDAILLDLDAATDVAVEAEADVETKAELVVDLDAEVDGKPDCDDPVTFDADAAVAAAVEV